MRIFKFSIFCNFCLKEKIEKFENIKFFVDLDFLKFEEFEKF